MRFPIWEETARRLEAIGVLERSPERGPLPPVAVLAAPSEDEPGDWHPEQDEIAERDDLR